MQVVASYSAKGGVGKTAAAVNLAYAAASQGIPTLFWDLDPQGSGSWYLRAKPRKRMNAEKLVGGKLAVGRLLRDTHYDNLAVMPADLSLRAMDTLLRKDDPTTKSGGALQRLIAPFGEMFALTVLDCPPSLSYLAEHILHAADATVVPVVPTHLSLRSLETVRKHCDTIGVKTKRLHPFYSMVDRRRTLHRRLLDDPPSIMKRRLATDIAYSSVVEKMGDHRAPLGAFAPSHPVTQAYDALWAELRVRLRDV